MHSLIDLLMGKLQPALPWITGLVVSTAWHFQHTAHRPRIAFLIADAVLAFFIAIVLLASIAACRIAMIKFHAPLFWKERACAYLTGLIFFISLLSSALFLKTEASIVILIGAVGGAISLLIDSFLSGYPGTLSIMPFWRRLLVFLWFVFLLEFLFQISAHHYYILDGTKNASHAPLTRAIGMFSVWVIMLCASIGVYFSVKNPMRNLAPLALVAGSVMAIISWVVNLAVLYYSGLYIRPSFLEHIKGSAGIVQGSTPLLFLGAAVAFSFIFIIFSFKFFHILRRVPPRHALLASLGGMFVFFLGAGFTIRSIWTAPEYVIARSFYEEFFEKKEPAPLPSALQKKLEKFGLFYHPDHFLVNTHEHVFDASKPPLAPEFARKRPNILILFLESYSAELTGVYSERYRNVTPRLNEIAKDSRVTVFRNTYNSSTPTITGVLSDLCSFLPPTGHGEIHINGKLQRYYLSCLPQIVKDAAHYKTIYSTSVEKDYAHKDVLFPSIGVDTVLGKDELKKYISEKPKSWGYSDHQTLPVILDIMEKSSQPFLMMHSTVDTHPPYNIAKDQIPYGDGKNGVLNGFHTTDDALGVFWDKFIKSPLADSTIVIMVGDHVAFPSAQVRALFPERKNLSFYERLFFTMYVPHTMLPKNVETVASSMDIAPTLLQLLNINVKNVFEGHSIFDDRAKYPSVLGMHDIGIYINQLLPDGTRKVEYAVPQKMACKPSSESSTSTSPLAMCEYYQYYQWKRRMLEDGRLWRGY